MTQKQTQDAYIVAAVRTPVGKAPRGMFKNVRPDDMLVHVLRAALGQCPGLDPAAVDDVIAGCAMPEAEQGINVARVALLLAGMPNNVPGMTVNRFCASGVQAVALAADRIRLGEADVMIGAGTESMSMVPMMGNKVAMNPAIFQHDENVGIAYGMGMTGEKVAQRWKISREAQDEFAVTSHARALKAIETGEFAQEIAPYTIEEKRPDLAAHEVRSVTTVKNTDEGPRPGTSLEALAKLKPVFAARGTVTAGNSSQMSDGAGAVIVVSEAALKR
ncbi:MAG: acetyl-CoA C-acyltransferase, partial [Pseudomonadota bacterium]